MLSKRLPREIPISVADFTRKYDVCKDAIFVRISTGTLPRSVMIGKGIINESYFLRRFAFMNHVKELNQSMVYLLETEFTIEDISRTITKLYGGKQTSIREYMNNTLFALQGEDVKIATTVRDRAWIVFKYARRIDNKLRKRGLSIDKILDARMKDIR